MAKLKICAICDSPTARSLHFGALACKACAAFFRRAVALDVTYKCNSKHPPCVIHHERRIICKRCRFEKCLNLGMRRELVQSKAGVETSQTATVTSTSVESPPGCSNTPSSTETESDDPFATVDHFVKIEAKLNDRRRLAHTKSTMRDILKEKVECPFTREDLRYFDFRSYKGYDRNEYVLVFEYVRDLPEFEHLSQSDQNVLLRYTCATDALLTTAYYTHKIGMRDKILVLSDGLYFPMDPLPLTGCEDNADEHFLDSADLQRYKSLVPPLVDNWFTLVLPLHDLNPSFAEFALLKALISWHISYYKLVADGRDVCQRQRNLITKALFALAKDDNTNGEVRVGQLLLFMSSCVENIYELVTGLHMMKFFGIMNLDPMLHELLDFSDA